MRLTRRDALAALGAAGAAGVAGFAMEGDLEATSKPLDRSMPTLVGAAEVLYPSAIEEIEPFVRRFVTGRVRAGTTHAEGLTSAVEYLDAYTNAWYDRPFAELPAATRDDALRRMGTDTADPDPKGSNVEQIRHYVVDELLFALYASPTGAALVGLENPPGHPGGLTSYQRGPSP